MNHSCRWFWVTRDIFVKLALAFPPACIGQRIDIVADQVHAAVAIEAVVFQPDHHVSRHARDLAQALIEVKEKIRLCSTCMNLTEQDPCALCNDPRREPDTICVVASPSDLIAIDRGGHFRGRYHVQCFALQAEAGCDGHA